MLFEIFQEDQHEVQMAEVISKLLAADVFEAYSAGKFILSGVLVGLGKTPLEAIEQVEQWERDGTSQLLAKSKMARGYL